jgi:hypothetical protein
MPDTPPTSRPFSVAVHAVAATCSGCQIDYVTVKPQKSGVTISFMTKRDSPASRRRGKPRLGRKTFVYFTDDERELIDEASKLERRSVSSFVANAAIAAAEQVANLHHTKKTRK